MEGLNSFVAGNRRQPGRERRSWLGGVLSLAVGILYVLAGPALADPDKGLNAAAHQELVAAGVTRYSGQFSPAVSAPAGVDGWTKHTYDTAGGNGPICIAGTPFTAFSRTASADKVMVFLDGGGACWQNFYFCSIVADAQLPGSLPGVFSASGEGPDGTIENPVGDWSVVFASYCDGSVFSGDNDVVDANFPFGPTRFHRGLRNVTAAIDLAKAIAPDASHVLITGSSAGGVGAAGNAAFLARMAWGNNAKLMVFNDAGPIATISGDPAAPVRAADWQFGQFFPASCTDCSELGSATELVKWRLANDTTVREAFYSTDGDATDRFFLGVPTQEAYRELLLTEHGPIHEAFPDRYQRFIRSGDDSHTALANDRFYSVDANGVPLHEWFEHMIAKRKPKWLDIVEDFEPLP